LCNACGLRYYRKTKSKKIKKASQTVSPSSTSKGNLVDVKTSQALIKNDVAGFKHKSISKPSSSFSQNLWTNLRSVEPNAQSRLKFKIQKLQPILSVTVPSGTPAHDTSALDCYLPTINLPYSFFNVATSSILPKNTTLTRSEGEEELRFQENSISLPISIGKLLNS
jgi:hypothetical protein